MAISTPCKVFIVIGVLGGVGFVAAILWAALPKTADSPNKISTYPSIIDWRK
jgi:hypothetical protein